MGWPDFIVAVFALIGLSAVVIWLALLIVFGVWGLVTSARADDEHTGGHGVGS